MSHLLASPRINDNRLKVSIAAHLRAKCTLLLCPGFGDYYSTYEPFSLGAIGGANLFWSEVGANPRDVEAKTEEGRSETVASCKAIFAESDWDVQYGPSRFYRKAGRSEHQPV